jgi:methionyl aminopeptidase
MMTLKTPEEIEIMAEGGRRLAEVIRELKQSVRAGMTTLELDTFAFALIKEAGAKPAFLHYRPYGAKKAYPFTLCASINDVVVHGQPSSYVIKDGDLVKLDLGLIYEKLYLDSAVTVGVGEVSSAAKKLIAVTEESLGAGIKEAKPGNTVGDIGAAIEKVITKKGFSVVEGLTGHGIGEALHEDPPIFNFGRKGRGMDLEVGMVIAIEPMVAIGRGAIVQRPDEGYGTADGSLSAHFEHTIAITEKGPRILTKI